MKKNFVSNYSFQAFTVFCCRKQQKYCWWYWYFPVVLNHFNFAKTGIIIGSSCMWYLYSWKCASIFFSFFKYFFFNVHFYNFWIFFFPFPRKLQISCSLLSSFQEWDQLSSSWKIKPHENKNFLICLDRVTTPF